MLNLKKWEPVEYQLGEALITFEVKRLNFLEEKAFSTRYNRVRRDKVVKFALMAQADQSERQRILVGRTNAALVAAGHEPVPLGADVSAAFTAAEQRATEAGVTVPEMTSSELGSLLVQDEDRIVQQQQALDEFFASIDTEWLTEVFGTYVNHVAGLEFDGQPVRTGADLLEFADQGLVLFVLQTIAGFASLPAAAKKASSSPLTSPGAEATSAGGASVAPPVASEDGMSGVTAPAIPTETLSSFGPVVVPMRSHG